MRTHMNKHKTTLSLSLSSSCGALPRRVLIRESALPAGQQSVCLSLEMCHINSESHFWANYEKQEFGATFYTFNWGRRDTESGPDNSLPTFIFTFLLVNSEPSCTPRWSQFPGIFLFIGSLRRDALAQEARPGFCLFNSPPIKHYLAVITCHSSPVFMHVFSLIKPNPRGKENNNTNRYYSDLSRACMQNKGMVIINLSPEVKGPGL